MMFRQILIEFSLSFKERRNAEREESKMSTNAMKRKFHITDDDDDDDDGEERSEENTDENIDNLRQRRFREFASVEYMGEIYMVINLSRELIGEKVRLF